MKTPLPKLLTLQLRPHIALALDDYIETVRARLPETVRAKITRSIIVRKLIGRAVARPETLVYLDTGRHRDNAQVQLRVRLSEADFNALVARANETNTSYARTIAALILEARFPDGNLPPNPDTKNTSTKDTP